MGSEFRFLLIVIALGGSFVLAWSIFSVKKCPTITQEELLYKVRSLFLETSEQFWSPDYYYLLEKLYFQYIELEKRSRNQDEVISQLLSFKEKFKNQSHLKTALFERSEAEKVAQLTAAELPTPNKDLETCKVDLHLKLEIINNLESQLEYCNSTYYEKEKLRKQQHIKTLETLARQKPPTKERIDPPAYLMEVSKTSSCNYFTNTTGIHWLEFTWMGENRAFCDRQLKGPGWMVIQRRTDGKTDFYRKWSEYREGFGDLSTEYFIGLENLHKFTIKFAPCELLIQLEDFEGETRFARYDNFEVGDENSSYELKSLGQYSGDAGDALSYNLHSKFSTYDRDSPDKCAQLNEGAWWYGESCGFSNLNGVYRSLGNQDFHKDGTGIFWQDKEWHDFDYSMKSVEMMIRSRVK